MTRITRRKVLSLSGAGVVATQTGGLAAILATGRAPAYAQGTNVHCARTRPWRSAALAHASGFERDHLAP